MKIEDEINRKSNLCYLILFYAFFNSFAARHPQSDFTMGL